MSSWLLYVEIDVVVNGWDGSHNEGDLLAYFSLQSCAHEPVTSYYIHFIFHRYSCDKVAAVDDYFNANDADGYRNVYYYYYKYHNGSSTADVYNADKGDEICGDVNGDDNVLWSESGNS